MKTKKKKEEKLWIPQNKLWAFRKRNALLSFSLTSFSGQRTLLEKFLTLWNFAFSFCSSFSEIAIRMPPGIHWDIHKPEVAPRIFIFFSNPNCNFHFFSHYDSFIISSFFLQFLSMQQAFLFISTLYLGILGCVSIPHFLPLLSLLVPQQNPIFPHFLACFLGNFFWVFLGIFWGTPFLFLGEFSLLGF